MPKDGLNESDCGSKTLGPPVFEPSTDLRCPDCDTIPVTRNGETFVSGSIRIRLYGLDAPDIGEPCADEATARLKLAGGTVRIEPGPRTIDRFGRSLAYVYTKSGVSIDEVLVAEGLAVAWTRDGQHRLRLIALEQEAKRKGCLW